MSNRGRLSMVGALALVGSVGCGKTRTDTGGIPAADAPVEIAQTVCAKAYDCCTPAQLMGNDLAGTDEPSCEQKTSDAFGKQVSAVLDSQDKYRSVYDGAKLEACLAYIRATSCHDLGTTNHFSGIPGCDSFVQPRVAQGSACTYDWECQEGQCHHDEGKLEGTCRPLTAAGEDCTNSKCAAGLLCDSQSKLCTAALADGAACLRGDQCDSGSCNLGTCGPPPGGTCFYSSGCAYGGQRPGALSLLGVLAAALFARRRVRRGAGKAR
jgi:hypothetical protein